VTAGEPQGSLRPYGALSFMYFASIGIYNPYAPLWFQSLGFSTLAIGAIASLQAWTRVAVPYGWSWLGDHWGHGTRRVDLLRIATALILVASLGLLFSTGVIVVAAIVTLIFTANQGLLAAKAGAWLLSPFVGRLDDINEDGMIVGELERYDKDWYFVAN